ncbi:hypothetical protein BRC60_08165, partial [Halobacteriales archaeon QH_1_68_42]
MARRSPTLALVGVFVVVYLVERLVGLFGVEKSAFALAPPVVTRPWTLVTSVSVGLRRAIPDLRTPGSRIPWGPGAGSRAS